MKENKHILKLELGAEELFEGGRVAQAEGHESLPALFKAALRAHIEAFRKRAEATAEEPAATATK